MKSYEGFKASREKMDPSSRKMNEHQWQQAYAAYKSTRERVHGHSSKSGKRSVSGKGGSSVPTSGLHTPSSVTPTAQLRSKVRAMSAYEEVRMLINLLAWIAIAVVLGHLVAQFIFYSSSETYLMSAVYAAIRLLAIVFFKSMAQVLIDIPDIALYRIHAQSAELDAAKSDPQ
ncbi:MAG: hypothetical protein ACPGJU_09665 [Coraliomargarita sp.]